MTRGQRYPGSNTYIGQVGNLDGQILAAHTRPRFRIHDPVSAASANAYDGLLVAFAHALRRGDLVGARGAGGMVGVALGQLDEKA